MRSKNREMFQKRKSKDISTSGDKQRFLTATVATAWYRSFESRLKKSGGYVGNIRSAKNAERVRNIRYQP